MKSDVESSDRRKTLRGIIISIPLIILILLISFFLYIGYDIVDGIDPDPLTGQDAHARISHFFGKSFPGSAEGLYFKEEGFQDYACEIVMEIPSEDAWKMINSFYGIKKSSFKKVKDVKSGLEIPGYWDVDKLESPMKYVVEKKRSILIIIYDEPAKRLLVHYSSS